MKKLLLASAVAALSVTAAQAAPTVYGKAFLTLDLNEGDTDTTNLLTNQVESTSEKGRSQLNSNGSRIGFKGAERLTENTDMVYQLEYGVKVDDNSTQFTSRDTFIGLSNKQYGTVLAGRLTAIDDMVNYANVTTGGVLGDDDVLASFTAERANNAFAYVSPNYNGVNFLGMYVMDEMAVRTPEYAAGLVSNNGTDSVGRDAFGIGAKYEPAGQPFKAGATYIQAGDALKALRVSGGYQVNPVLSVGALYQHTDFNTNDNENAIAVSGQYKLAQTPWTAYGQVDLVDNVGGAKDAEKQRLVVGGKYAFNANTTGHVYGAALNEETVTFAGTTAVEREEFKGIGFGAGLEYKF